MSDVAAEISKMITDMRKASHGDLSMTDSLDKLGLDSMQVVELTFLIEEKYNIEVPFNANAEFEVKTVGELVHAVEGLVAAKAGSN